MIASNPDKAEALIARMFPLSTEHHWAIVRAIAYSGLPEWQTLLQRTAERMPARRVMIERFLAGKLPTLDQAPIEKDETWGEQLRAQFTLAKYFSKAEAGVGARTHARPARHALGLFLRDRKLPAARRASS